MFSHQALVGRLVCSSTDAFTRLPQASVGHVLRGRSMCGQCASAGFVVENGCMLGIVARPVNHAALSVDCVAPASESCSSLLLEDTLACPSVDVVVTQDISSSRAMPAAVAPAKRNVQA